MATRSKLYSFGPYTLDLGAAELRSGRQAIDLTPKQFRALELLANAGGEAVSKEQLQAGIWRDGFVEDGNLTQVIFQLRRTLGRQADGREYIETLPRKGYRLDPEVFRVIAQPVQPASSSGSNVREMNVELYQILVDAIEDYAIYMLDCGGRICSWNLGAERNKGYEAAEVIGRHYSLFFVPEDIEERVPERQLRAASQGGRHIGEGWRLRKNGERFWASFVLTAMRDADRKLIGFAKVVRDISARKRKEDHILSMEAMARRDHARLSAAAESSMDAFYICESIRDESGEIEDFLFTYLNRNVEKMVSLPREALLNGKMCELFPVNRSTGLFDCYKKVVETGDPFIAEFKVDAEHVVSEWVRVQAVRLEDGVAITASDVTERKRAEERILQLMHLDPLTGLHNRSLLQDRISQAIERVKRFGGKVGVCMIDLDLFKPINDEYGHQMGDQVLIETAQRLLSAVRATDSVLRVGGDEFVVVPMEIERKTVKVDCSLGIAVYPDDATEIQGLLSAADQAMYKMKIAGRIRAQAELAGKAISSPVLGRGML